MLGSHTSPSLIDEILLQAYWSPRTTFGTHFQKRITLVPNRRKLASRQRILRFLKPERKLATGFSPLLPRIRIAMTQRVLMCTMHVGRNFSERTGITVKWNFELFLGPISTVTEEMRRVLPREWEPIRCCCRFGTRSKPHKCVLRLDHSS
jgi:hypothetical protein